MNRRLAIPLLFLVPTLAGLCRADVVALWRVAILGFLLLAMIGLRRNEIARYHYLVGCSLAACFYLSRIASAREPSFGFAVSWFVNGLIVACAGGWYLVARARALRTPGATAPLSRPEKWFVLCGGALGFYYFITLGQGSPYRWDRVTAALLRWVATLNVAALLVLLPKAVASSRRAKTVAGLVISVCALALGTGAARYHYLARLLDRAQAEYGAHQLDQTKDLLRRVAAENRLLQSHGLSDRAELLKTDLTASSGDYSEALRGILEYLRVASSIGFRKPAVKEDFDSYFQRTPIQILVNKRSTRDSRRLFDRLHYSLGRRPLLAEKMHWLFLKSGFVDHLQERYASAGPLPICDPQPFVVALAEIAASKPDPPGTVATKTVSGERPAIFTPRITVHSLVAAAYLKGMVLYQSHDPEEAERALRDVLAVRPDHANAISLLERIAARRGDTGALSELRTRERRIVNAEMMGNHIRGLNVIKVLWTPLEVNPGRYEFEVDMRGKPAVDVWPECRAYLDDSSEPVFAESVESREWTTLRFHLEFVSSGWHRLLFSFENDFKSVSAQGATEDRNLELREVRIRYRPAEPSLRSN
jgi:hypothetical protein